MQYFKNINLSILQITLGFGNLISLPEHSIHTTQKPVD
jgi:hypothetical protein